MPKVTINGITIEVEEGTTILQAAQRAGIEIPHYCYHPRLSIAGNCRMCLVEVEGVPKLQTACSTRVQDGMVVHTDNERVRKAVRGVLEFILLNHPIDCPVCDQAGECGLQDYYMKYGLHRSRFALEEKVLKFKAKYIGGLIMLDSERCILCTRCIRFLREVVGTDELNIFGRGSHSAVDIYPGRPLSNKYTCNLADICPVGALTDREFRFRCRVWFLKATRSICPGCATGCNVELHYHRGKVYRIKPSLNEDVNGVWMCDIGRLSFKLVNENRIDRPYERIGGEKVETGWDAVFYSAYFKIKGIIEKHGPSSVYVLASPRSSNEELYLTKKFAFEVLKTPNLTFTSRVKADPYHDDFLVKEDKNPNTRGAQELGIAPAEGGRDFEGLLEDMRNGKVRALLIVGSCLGDLEDDEVRSLLSGVDYVVNISSNESVVSGSSHLVLPSASFAEKEGTYTNFSGRVQRFFRAFPPRWDARDEIQVFNGLARKFGFDWNYRDAQEVFDEMAQKEPFFAGLSYSVVGYYGFQVGEKV